MSDGRVCAIGLDVGGTKIAAGLVLAESGEVRQRRIVPTKASCGGQAVLERCSALIDELLAAANADNLVVAGAGVAVAELVDPAGNVTSAQTIGWSDLSVQALLSKRIPTVVESDVRAAALAEARYGAGLDYRTFAYVTVGTGISSTLVLNGEPFAGARGNALVLATMPLTTTCTECDAQLSPILEEYASGPAIARRYDERLHKSSQAAHEPIERAETVINAAENGDQGAVYVVTSAGEALGVSVGWLANVLDPEAVVVGGGLGLAGGLYWEHFVRSTRAHIYADTTRDLPILPAQLGVDAGIVGAATYAFTRLRGRVP